MTDYAHDKVVPDKASSKTKKEQVAGMFDDIANRYDFLNRFLSVGIDVSWRKKALQHFKSNPPKLLLDVATGTADVAIMATKMHQIDKTIGIDISDGMLKIGREKVEKNGMVQQIELINGDSESIQFEDNYFDAATVSFGVRNFQNLEKGLLEIKRVLKPGGKLVVLEFSKPTTPVVGFFYNFYMKMVAPNMGKLFSKNGAAYKYLDESIKKFPEGKQFIQVMNQLGYTKTEFKKLSFGICCIYVGTK